MDTTETFVLMMHEQLSSLHVGSGIYHGHLIYMNICREDVEVALQLAARQTWLGN